MEYTIEEQMLRLQQPFPEDRVVWRVQRTNVEGDKPWAMVLAYMDNRAVQERLDEVVGINNWKNEFKTAPDGGTLCGISIKFDGEWVTKWDGAENTQVEAVKGGLSSSMKRAAVQWGIGRYLYDLDNNFVPLVKNKEDNSIQYYDKQSNQKFYWTPPELPKWALPKKYNFTDEQLVTILEKTREVKEKTGLNKQQINEYMPKEGSSFFEMIKALDGLIPKQLQNTAENIPLDIKLTAEGEQK